MNSAQNNPVILSGTEETSQQDIGQSNSRLMKSTGRGKDSLEPSILARVSDQPLDGEKMAMLEFMNEPVTIRIATSTDPNAEQVFELNINGKMEFFRRGEQKTLPRYFVDRLMRLKVTTFSQKETTNAEGIRDYLHIPHTGLKYDFAIIRDDNKLGRSWERAVLAEHG